MIHGSDPIGRYIEVYDHRGIFVSRLVAVEPATGEAIQQLPQFFIGPFKPLIRFISRMTGEVPTRHFFLQKGFKVFYLDPFGGRTLITEFSHTAKKK